MFTEIIVILLVVFGEQHIIILLFIRHTLLFFEKSEQNKALLSTNVLHVLYPRHPHSQLTITYIVIRVNLLLTPAFVRFHLTHKSHCIQMVGNFSLYSWRFPLPYCSYKAAPAHPNSLNLPLPVKLAPSPM